MRPAAPHPNIQYDQDLIRDVRVQLQLADQKVTTLEASHNEMHEHQVALRKNHLDCYNALINEQHDWLEWARAYGYVYKEFKKLACQIQELHNTTAPLQQRLNRAYETMKDYQIRIVDLEGLLDSIVTPVDLSHNKVGTEAEASLTKTEDAEVEINDEKTQVKDGNTSRCLSSIEEQAEMADHESKSPSTYLIASPAVDDHCSSKDWRAREGGSALRRLRARKSRQSKARD